MQDVKEEIDPIWLPHMSSSEKLYELRLENLVGNLAR